MRKQNPIADKVAAYFSQFPLRSYPKGHMLVFSNEDPDYIYYLIKGRVKQFDVSYRGDEVILNVFGPRAFFPMSWAINRTPNKFFFQTDSKVELRAVPADKALIFLKTNPDVALDLLSRVYQGMDGILGRLVHLMSGTAKSRLVYELIIDCRRFGEQIDGGKWTVKVNEKDLAARTGLSRETVNREFRKLKATGVADIANNIIVINNLAALEELLGDEV